VLGHSVVLLAVLVGAFAFGQRFPWGMERRFEWAEDGASLAKVSFLNATNVTPVPSTELGEKPGAVNDPGVLDPSQVPDRVGSKAQDEFAAWMLSRAETPSLREEVQSLLQRARQGDPVERLEQLMLAFAAVGFRGDDVAAWKIFAGREGLLVPREHKRVEGDFIEPSAAIFQSQMDLLADSALPPSVRATVGTWLALGWVQAGLYDEAKRILDAFTPEASAVPEVAFYCRAITEYQLGNGAEAQEAGRWLLSQAGAIPARYQLIARAVTAEASRWERSPLRHASQWMGDAARRLELARRDPELLPLQDRILEILDRLIEQASRKQKKAQATSSGNIRSASPAEESFPMGGKGAGEAPRKPIGKPAHWGDLPPKDREEALQMIHREFPPHYRQAIEEYFRRLAEEPENKPAASLQSP